jgi:hypothetical protein
MADRKAGQTAKARVREAGDKACVPLDVVVGVSVAVTVFAAGIAYYAFYETDPVRAGWFYAGSQLAACMAVALAILVRRRCVQNRSSSSCLCMLRHRQNRRNSNESRCDS